MNFLLAAVCSMSLAMLTVPASAQNGDAMRGQRIFQTCAACHSLEPGRNMTGPSLAELWGRKAGGLSNFSRYSQALKSSGIVWQDKTLDEWLSDPQHFLPGTSMTFPGVKSPDQRADLMAFLKQATKPGAAPAATARRGQMGGMMMGGGAAPNLKKVGSEARVEKIAHCQDTYRVTTADGKTRDFWERNLRFKTDASDEGPRPGAPAIVGAGMMGDRADVIFAAPDEISRLISSGC